VIWFAGVRSGTKLAAIAVSMSGCRDWAASAPAGTRYKPNTKLNPSNVVIAGNIAKAATAAKAAAAVLPTMKAVASAYAVSARGAYSVTPIAAHVTAIAP